MSVILSINDLKDFLFDEGLRDVIVAKDGAPPQDAMDKMVARTIDELPVEKSIHIYSRYSPVPPGPGNMFRTVWPDADFQKILRLPIMAPGSPLAVCAAIRGFL